MISPGGNRCCRRDNHRCRFVNAKCRQCAQSAAERARESPTRTDPITGTTGVRPVDYRNNHNYALSERFS